MNTTGYRISRYAHTMAAYHGLTTSALVAIARDLNLNVQVQGTAGRRSTQWVIVEPTSTLRVLADHLDELAAI